MHSDNDLRAVVPAAPHATTSLLVLTYFQYVGDYPWRDGRDTIHAEYHEGC